MKAMVLNRLSRLAETKTPLDLEERPVPRPAGGEVLIDVLACGVCHTELDEIEGRTPPANLPIVLGHQVVGRVEQLGIGASRFKVGDRVGVAWIFSSCGRCRYCLGGNENLCPQFKATGRDAQGGYGEYMSVGEDFAYPIPESLTTVGAAPLLCAGAIGYRSVRLAGLRDGQNLGLTGFGASAHLVVKMVKRQYPDIKIFVFARSETERRFAKELGAAWVGDTADVPPARLASIIDTTPVWTPMVEALASLEPGGRLVVNAIRKEDVDKAVLASLDYPTHLWMEKEIKSVANVSRRDVIEFLRLAGEISITPEVQEFRLEEANEALSQLKEGRIRGAKVLVMER